MNKAAWCLSLAALAAAVAGWPRPSARAAGLEVFNHGARAMGRAGAFVAGADDPGGIWYNPASIGGLAGIQVLADAALIFYEAHYRRVDSGGNELPWVSNSGPIVPVPTLALSVPVWRDRLFVGGAVSAPYSPYIKYPRPGYGPCSSPETRNCIDTAYEDAPQRYSAISNEGTRIIQLDLTIAARIWDSLYIGASVQNLFVTYDTLSSISSYNGVLSSGPEDPEFDSLTQMLLTTNFNPSAKFGVTWSPIRQLRLGVAYQLPFWIRGDATINVQLPVSALYQRATVEGDQAKVALDLPMSLRVGGEWTVLPTMRLELDIEWVQWSQTKSIEVKPQNIYILNLPSIDRFKVPIMEVPLLFRDTFALRLGGEYQIGRLPLVVRAGYVFERGAVQQQYASVLSLDNDKHVITVGASYTLRRFRFDLGVARSFSAERVVGFQESQIRQINPINPSSAATVGGGRYNSDFTLLGIGVHKAF